ncbi:MAG: adenylosuccinate lyase [Bacteroidota bacterium]|nr:adenylosuccinate lyase [Bacteroidota bacterium]
MVRAISPLDGRYEETVSALQEYFSEYALFKYRCKVEVEYFISLSSLKLKNFTLSADMHDSLRNIYLKFSPEDALQIKDIEKTTKHDIKAVEYFIKNKLKVLGISALEEWVHFGLTSQDINNTAIPMLLRDATVDILMPILEECTDKLYKNGHQWKSIPMLSHTHGQAASPTTMGKEVFVFVERLNKQLHTLKSYEYCGKFGGASGNFNAHKISFPEINWIDWADEFLQHTLGLTRQHYTTQIAHYDEIAEYLQLLSRINTILIDLCRDMWTYISMDYFKQKIVEGEVGSSAMPHKVNPIDFENAEGNLGLSNAVAHHLAEKLPVSRLQRDLTDSTVLRNIGVPIAHTYLSVKSIMKGLDKLILQPEKLTTDLNSNWIILAEAIQTILRREGYPKPYEVLKELTRGKSTISQNELHQFLEQLNLPMELKNELTALRPENYIGYAADEFKNLFKPTH